ncbi:FlgD immunoglobulin-like domain containing protein [Candidatus Cloacimonadota bacterium]
MKKMYMSMMIIWIGFCGLLCDTINVPDDYTTIQGAINNAENGDLILVAEGTYYENIDFLGKSITVASHFYLDNELDHILNTIINGSQPDDPALASCVRMLSGEDSNTVLLGFTLTGGQGTAYEFAVNAVYKEGGCIITDNSTAIIKNNLIIENEALVIAGTLGGGGGGISAIFSSPQIMNNVIMLNTASYAAGLVLNWSGGLVKNNIIYANYGGGDFGTGGLMVWDVGPTTAVVENNTIVGNISYSTAGGLSVTNSSAVIRNNIIWGNQQVSGLQVTGINNSTFEYCCLEDEMNGEGHVFDYPEFTTENFILSALSACIDSGDPTAEFYDIEDPAFPGNALFPSLGGLRNDIGAYGGDYAQLLPEVEYEDLILPEMIEFSSNLTVGETDTIEFSIMNMSTKAFEISYIDGIDPDLQYEGNDFDLLLKQFKQGTISFSWTPMTAGWLSSFIYIYHNFTSYDNPLIIPVSGNAAGTHSPEDFIYPGTIGLHNYPNPFNPQTVIEFHLPTEMSRDDIKLEIYNSKGQLVRYFSVESDQSSVIWNGKDDMGRAVVSGVYYFSILQGKNTISTEKGVLLK